MPLQLIVIIIFVSLSLIVYILHHIKNDSLSTKYSLIWIGICLCLILFSLSYEWLLKAATFFGIEKVSNMLFFFGFVFLLVVTFNMTKSISKLNKEIIKLTQELGIARDREKQK